VYKLCEWEVVGYVLAGVHDSRTKHRKQQGRIPTQCYRC